MPRRKKDEPVLAERKFYRVRWTMLAAEDLAAMAYIDAAMARVHEAKASKKYWIHTETVECPLCWRTTVTRERRYTPKPKNKHDRNSYDQCWCRCNP
jgi:hypothetical protein